MLVQGTDPSRILLIGTSGLFYFIKLFQDLLIGYSIPVATATVHRVRNFLEKLPEAASLRPYGLQEGLSRHSLRRYKGPLRVDKRGLIIKERYLAKHDS
jgi:hypothetical protein